MELRRMRFENPVTRVLNRAKDEAALDVLGGERWTVGALMDEVKRCADWMHSLDVGFRSRVICDSGRGAEHVICMLACWWVGAVFVPLPRDVPARRRQRLVRTIQPALDPRDWNRSLWRHRRLTSFAPFPLEGDHIAYIAFTSGSGGEPKGALVAHRGLVPLANAQAELFRASRGHRTSWLLSAHFDASFSDILVPLCARAELVVFPELSGDEHASARFDAIADARVTHIDLPPSQLRALLLRGLPEALQTIVVGGEPAPREVLRDAAAHVRVINVYGPTETTVCVSAEIISTDAPDRASIGTPLDHVIFRVEEDGELWIGGECVAAGYLLEPDPSPFVEVDGRNWYRSGDLVQRETDGSYTFLGRVDRQVQIRGRRFEPEEVESVLLGHPEVQDAAVLAEGGSAAQIVAVVHGTCDREALETWLSEELETWKIPSRLELTGALPRLANGKLDRAELRARFIHQAAEPPAATGVELDPLLLAWRSVFGDASRGDDERFDERGGDSVRALELCVEASRHGVALEPELLAQHPRLGDLRGAVARGAPVEELARFADAARRALSLGPTTAAHGPRPTAFVTGATGFLGRWLVSELLARGLEVIALVRSGAHHEFPANVTSVTGDVSRDGLGLSDSDRARIVKCVGLVIHAAGAVDITRSYASLAPVHVDGTARALQLAIDAGAPFHLVSSLSVFAESDVRGPTVPDGHDLMQARAVHGGYAQSKWVADALVQGADWSCSTTRLGLLVGPDQLGRAANDQLSRTIRGLACLGAWPIACDTRAFDLTPVRASARVVAHVAAAQLDGSPSVRLPQTPLHVARCQAATGGALFEAMRAEGIKLDRVSEWPPRSDLAAGDPDVAVALSATTARIRGREMSLPRAGDLFLCTDLALESEEAARLAGDSLSAAPTVHELRALVRLALP